MAALRVVDVPCVVLALWLPFLCWLLRLPLRFVCDLCEVPVHESLFLAALAAYTAYGGSRADFYVC